jgi:hypothetical protein
VSRTSLADLSGRTIRSLRVVTRAPESLPGLASVLDRFHVRTRESTIRRQLLVAPGDTVDTLRVAESLRRLRRLRYIADASVEGSGCGDGAVDLAVTTRDDWSTKPSLQVRSPSSAFELTERNLLGTGREATVSVRSDLGRVGVGASLRDPWFAGGRLALVVGTNGYRDGDEWYASIGRRERTLLDRWGIEAQASRAVRDPTPSGTSDSGSATRLEVRRVRAGLLVSRRVAASDAAVTSIVAGADYERTGVAAAPGAMLVGPDRVRREVAALDLGVMRRSIAFDTTTWMLAGGGISDIPLSLEVDALVGLGRERVSGAPVARLDLWTGRVWIPSAGALLVADGWASGYRTPERWSAGTVRGSLLYLHAAPRGTWSARLFAEELFDPDPDVRALTSLDPTLPALETAARLAEAGVGASVERAVHLRPLSRSWMVDGAAFGAFSTRWDPAMHVVGAGSAERLNAAVLGVGLRLAPTKPGRATARLDVGFPVFGTGAERRPFIGLSVSSWLDQGRRRDGRGAR